MISKITDLKWASTTASDYNEPEPEGVVRRDRDVIAVLRSAIRAVSTIWSWLLYSSDISQQIRSSSLRREVFADMCRSAKLKDYELVRDVDTRWSSTYLMISRALKLRKVMLLRLILFGILAYTLRYLNIANEPIPLR